MKKKLIKIIKEAGDVADAVGMKDWVIEDIADAIINSKLFCNGPDAMDEQEPHVYKWTAIENDGYTRMESGVALNMFDAFIKATEYSPDYHKKVVIEKIPDNELTENQKELKEWWIAYHFEEKENA